MVKIKKGDKYVCIKDVVMDNGRTVYTKSKLYNCEKENCLTDDEGTKDHIVYSEFYFKSDELPETFLDTHFIPYISESKNDLGTHTDWRGYWHAGNTVKVESISPTGGIKEIVEKSDYSEINLEILDLMSERMMANKHKYPKGNSKKPIEPGLLEWAIFRHIKKILKPIPNDPESKKDHLAAIACNVSMILDQMELVENKEVPRHHIIPNNEFWSNLTKHWEEALTGSKGTNKK